MTWRTALRMARRSMRRNLRRSLLIAALVAVPIAGATVMDGFLRTLNGAEYRAYSSMGNADGTAEITNHPTLTRWEPGLFPELELEEDSRNPESVDLLGLLPPGSRAVREPEYYQLRLAEGDRIVRTELQLFPVGDPLTEHHARLVSGRAPDGPAEAVVSEPLAERLGLLDGDELRRDAAITAEGGDTVAVTGVVVSPNSLGLETVVAPPGSPLAVPRADEVEIPQLARYYVDLPDGVRADDVWPALAEDHGVAFTPKEVYTEPDRYPRGYWSFDNELLNAAGPIAAVVGFGALEVVLLAGTAFAVGARRQVRELGLIAANGGTARHVRRTVLAQGLFLGAVGALAGLALGWVVLVAGTPFWEPLTGVLVDTWRFGWVELTMVGVLGLLSGLAAALVPAIGVSRMRPVDALAQRFRTTSVRARLPVLGLVLLGVGIAGVIAAGVWARQLVAEADALLEEPTTDFLPVPDLTPPIVAVAVAGLAVVVGVIRVSSGLLSALARIGWRLPLSGRLAVRDAGRHRHRTVPAVTAIMIVVAGSVALAFSFAAQVADDYKSQPDNSITVSTTQAWPLTEDEKADLAEGAAEVANALPGAVAHEITMVSEAENVTVALGAPQDGRFMCEGRLAMLGIASPEIIELATGSPPSTEVTSALAAGKVVATDECVVSDGTVTTSPYEEGDETVSLPALYVPVEENTYFYDLPGAFISAEAAAEQGWTTTVSAQMVVHDGTATDDDLDAALTAAENRGLDARRESDDTEEVNLVNLGLAGGAGLVTLLGVGITVALSAAEGRADLATLAAIGAQPRRRRTLAGAQALVLGGLGTVLGLVVGGVLGFAFIPLSGDTAFAMPWQHLAVTALVVPLLAVTVAMVTTRANLPMVRRVE